MKTSTKIALLSIGAFAVYNHLQRKNNNPKIYVKKKLVNNYNARTIPPIGIFITEANKNNQTLINHELVHWQQYQKKGLIKFYADYFSQLNKYGYDAMPMEIEARYNETNFCKLNYTYCVANGISNTVNNINFRQ